jgi:8-oxo-dGTP pyrophosphatase MutT (NUDIX family)
MNTALPRSAQPLKERIRAALASHTPERKDAGTLTRASVLVPLFAEHADGQAAVWLVRRSDGLRTHSGQVALPGGKRDVSDATPLATALREAEEEIGLDPQSVDVLGALDDHVSGTGFVISPYVGWISTPFEPKPLPGEVARAFAVPLSVFRGEPSMLHLYDAQNTLRSVASFEVGGETVWGITAAILRDLVRRIP